MAASGCGTVKTTWHGQQLALAGGEPACPRRSLALRAMAIAAGVVGDPRTPAALAGLDMTAERRGPAGRASSMGRLTLNVLLSFAQFEREVTGERIRDKIAASKRKGLWMGGQVPLGYRVRERKLVIDKEEAATVRLDVRALPRARLVAGPP